MWPNNAKTAVSFTYDDGDGSGIDIAAPDLAEAGMRGTFYITPGMYDVLDRAADWARLAREGHEIGNHTWSHPCDRLRSFDSLSFHNEELGKAEQWLNDNIGFDPERTYAYICGVLSLGPEPGSRQRYFDLVRRTFIAARSLGVSPSSAEAAVREPYSIAARAVTWGEDDSEAGIEYLENAAKIEGGWAVLCFHRISLGKAQNEIETSRHAHKSLVSHVAASPERFWAAPFRDVYRSALRYAVERAKLSR